jgi:hypothetical protein
VVMTMASKSTFGRLVSFLSILIYL